MPFGFHTKHSNKSQQLLENPLVQPPSQQLLQQQTPAQQQQQQHPQLQLDPSAPPPPLPVGDTASPSSFARRDDRCWDRPRPQSQVESRDEPAAFRPPLRTNTIQGIESAYQPPPSLSSPTRSQSQRQSQFANYSIPLGAPRNGEDPGAELSTASHSSESFTVLPQQTPVQPAPAEQKKSKTRFFGFAKSSRESPSTPPVSSSTHNNTAGLGRRASKRHSDIPPALRKPYPAALGDPQHLAERQPAQPGWSGPSTDSLPTSAVSASASQVPPDQKPRDSFKSQRASQELVDELHLTHPVHGQPRQELQPTLRVVEQESGSQVSPQQGESYPLSVDNRSQVPYVAFAPDARQPAIVPPSAYASTLTPQIVPNLDGSSPVSHESPVYPRDDERPGTAASISRISIGSEGFVRDPPSRQSSFGTGSIHSPMAPVQQQPHHLRRPDPKMQNETREGPPPNLRPQYQVAPGQAPPAAVAAMQQQPQGPPPAYRGPPQQFTSASSSDQGRSTPPPALDGKETTDPMKDLLIKYKKVKALYFERTTQVEQLQNAIANQRLTQSRTSLDDSEYSTRFNRLDGAVNNLAFNLRKDWESVPAWLSPYVTADAVKKGTKEMMAVGRAVISRWLVDQVFQNVFHPGLDYDLSRELKLIELNIRHNATTPTNQEESDSLTSRVVQWRLTTLDGLAGVLQSPKADENRQTFLSLSVSNLTAALLAHLNESVGEDALKGSVAGIIELAVGIASNVPLESRDLYISYPLPGEPITQHMKVEPQLPPLEAGDANSDGADKQDAGKDEKSQREKAMGGKAVDDAKSIDDIPRVRYAGFVGVDVRGRQVLVKPTVWAI